MGAAMELIIGYVTQPNTTFTAWTMGSGNSLTMRNAPSGRIELLQLWADNQTAGNLRVRSPHFHDNVQGMRFYVKASKVEPLMPWGMPQMLNPVDTLIAEQTGSNTSGDIESGALLVHYQNLPGADAQFIDEAALMARQERIVTVENTLALGTGGGWSGEEALNAEFSLLKSGKQYAILGYTVSAECLAVAWAGSEFGNFRVGGPGNDDDSWLTNNWFVRLTREYRRPLIPVFNASNVGAVNVLGVQDENGTDTVLTTILAELR